MYVKKSVIWLFCSTFKYYSPLQNSRIRLKVIFTQFLQNSKGTEMKKKHSWHLFSLQVRNTCGYLWNDYSLLLEPNGTNDYTNYTRVLITMTDRKLFHFTYDNNYSERALRIWVGYNNLIFGEPGQNNCSSKFAHNDRKTFAGRKC